jgi:ABC-type lipoprotein release transport system permease subunit
VAAVSIVVGALVVRWSLNGLVSEPVRFGEAWDVHVSFSADELRAGAGRLAADPRVAAVAISHRGGLNVVDRHGNPARVAATGIEAVTGPLALTVLAGHAPSGPREIALASGTMHALGLEVGDRTTVSGACGSSEMVVTGRVRVPLTGGDDTDAGSIVPLRDLDGLCAQDLIGSADVNNVALVRFSEPVSAPAVRDEWRREGLHVTDRSTPGSVSSLADIRPVPVLVAVLIGLLGTAAAAHALVLGVRRQRHDVAVLRTLGLRPRQASGIVPWHAATLAMLTVAIGLPIGLVSGRLVWTAIAEPSSMLVHVDVDMLGLALVVGAIVAIAALLSIWPAHRAARLAPGAVLRSE